MRILVLAALLLTVSACATYTPPVPGQPGPGGAPPPIPLDGPIAYRCANGAQLIVDVEGANARVAIVGGPSMVLPRTSVGAYSNGRYSFSGGGADAQWQAAGAAATACHGS